MSKKRGKQPKVRTLFARDQHNGVKLKGKFYKPTVLRIEDHYEDGRIKTLQMIHDDQTVSVEDETQRHFLIAFVNEDMLKKTAN